MDGKLNVLVQEDGYTQIVSGGLDIPGDPQLVFAFHKDDEGGVRAVMMSNGEGDWTAADVLRALGGAFGSLKEQIVFGKGI